MSTAPDSYYDKVHPGDVISANLFNDVQAKIKADIAKQIGDAISKIKVVDQAGDAGKIDGKTLKEIEEEIIQKALAEIPKRTGYKMIFKRLTKDDEKVVKHDLKALPLVDLYQLDYFEVVCAEGDEKEDKENKFVNFYLYHTDEKEQKSAEFATDKRRIIIEPTDGKHTPFKIPFAKMLDLVGVKPAEDESLGDIVTEFWDALFSAPNDQFDPDQYCHSPWFEKCCGEQRSYATLKQRGNWDEIWFQMRPRKMLHFPDVSEVVQRVIKPIVGAPPTPPDLPNAMADVQVVHFDFDSIGLQLLSDPVYPEAVKIEPKAKKELKVMALLKV